MSINHSSAVVLTDVSFAWPDGTAALELIRSPSHTKSRIGVLPHDFAAGSRCACG